MFAVLEAWDEGTGPAIGSAGTANWNERKPATPWLDPDVGPLGSRDGNRVGDFAPTNGDASYDVPLDTSVAQDWVNDPATNQGLVLLVTGSTSDVHFYSREAADPTKRPELAIAFMPP